LCRALVDRSREIWRQRQPLPAQQVRRPIVTNPVTVATMQTTKREIRRRVRRQLMLRRLRNELATGGQDIDTVLRRPKPR
jgi:hypothetical protein